MREDDRGRYGTVGEVPREDTIRLLWNSSIKKELLFQSQIN